MDCRRRPVGGAARKAVFGRLAADKCRRPNPVGHFAHTEAEAASPPLDAGDGSMRFAPVGNIAVDLGKVLADLGDDLAVRGGSSELVDKQPRVAAHDAAQISILGQGRGATRKPNVRTLTLATVIAFINRRVRQCAGYCTDQPSGHRYHRLALNQRCAQ